MRRLIIILLFLVASVVAGLEISRHPGYLLLSYHAWMVQMPLWFAVLSAIMAFALFYILIGSIDGLQFTWYRFKNWLRLRRERQSYSKTKYGLSLLVEGRWAKAEKLLLQGATQSVEPLMNYLGAAKAAQQQGALERRDRYIKKAYEIAPNADLTIGLTQAELEYEHNQLEQAEATLQHLQHHNPRHPRVLQLLEKIYVRLADWKNLQNLLPNLRKAKMVNKEQEGLFEKNIYCEIFHTANNKTLPELQQLWNDLPRSMRKNPEVVCAYVLQLKRFNETVEIENLIRRTLKISWQPELVKIYSTLNFSNPQRQLVIVGAWLKLYGPQQEILLTLGRLCIRVQLWGKAQDYFTKCLALGSNREASLEYGKLLESLGENDQALIKYREALEIENNI